MGSTIHAAGGVLWREGPDGVEVALVHRPKHDDWSLPKGKLDDGETFLQAAQREITEETGQHVEVGRPLGEVRYLVHEASGTSEKVVCYWAMRRVGGRFEPGNEVDDLRWLSAQQATTQATHDLDREVLRRFSDDEHTSSDEG